MTNVSTIITAHNEEAFLGAAIESVLAQDLPAREIVVVNDASTDGTQSVIDGYTRSGGTPILNITLSRNRGAPFARNFGAAQAQGELLAFLDGDDLWFPGKLTVQCGLLEQHPEAGYTYGSAISFGEGSVSSTPERMGSSSGIYRGIDLCIGYLRDTYWNFWPSGLLIRRANFLASGGFVEALGAYQHWEDYFYACALALPETAYVTEEPLTYYRLHDASCSRHAETTKKTIVDERVGIEWFVDHLNTRPDGLLSREIGLALNARLARNVQQFAEASQERPGLERYARLYTPSALDRLQAGLDALLVSSGATGYGLQA